MKPKLISFKFTKKQEESKGKTSKSKKNYENIFNDILSGIKKPKNSLYLEYSGFNNNKIGYKTMTN